MASLRLIQRCAEWIPRDKIKEIPRRRRGIYVLYRKRGRLPARRPRGKYHPDRYDVLYVGMADSSMRARLRSHAKSKRKKAWTHCSVYEVWPNITEDEIRELEGLFRHIYRRDGRANMLNLQKSFQAMRRIRERDFKRWRDWENRGRF